MANQIPTKPYPRAAAAPRKGSAPRPGSSQKPPKTKRRAEIHGLRGLAIALVVMYHLWGAGRVSGGVDVFLMISAYLMVGSFVRRGVTFNLLDFLINRFRKLIPQAWLVILTVLVTSWYVMPPLKWAGLLQQAASSLLYFQNWTLISLATDYNAADRSDTSVYQHFWSLSMQGQVFVIWPLLMMLAIGVHRYAKVEIRTTLIVSFSAIGLMSFWYALDELQTHAAAAYFNTWARLWEFALASVIALVPEPKLSRWGSMRLSWLGLAGVVLGGVIVGRQSFPGPAALVPALSAVLVIWAGTSRSRLHAGWWLSTTPLGWLGDRAYAIYLWHWPVYMIHLYALDVPKLGFMGSASVILMSLLLADISTRLVDRGFNKWGLLEQRPYALMSMGTFLITGLASVQVMQFAVHTGPATASTTKPAAAPPAATSESPTPSTAPLPYGGTTGRVAEPGDLKVGTDWPDKFTPCHSELNVPVGECFEILPTGQPSKRVVIFGDSHAWQWGTATGHMAREQNWHLIIFFKGACRNVISSDDQGCVNYSAEIRNWIVKYKPDHALTIATRASSNGREVATETHLEAMRPLLDAGINVINIRDNPRFSMKMPECVQRYGSDDPRCHFEVSERLAPVSPMAQWYSVPGMSFIDMTAAICPDAHCPSVRDGMYVYMDDNHLTRTYISSITPQFEAQLRAAMGL